MSLITLARGWRRTFISMVLWVGLVGTAAAQDLEPEPERARDPFWPVGYVPPGPDDLREDEDATMSHLEWPSLRMRGRMRGRDGAQLVLIEGAGIVGAGDLVSLPDRGHWFHWRITSVTQHSIYFVRLGITTDREPGEAWLQSRENDPDKIEETQQ